MPSDGCWLGPEQRPCIWLPAAWSGTPRAARPFIAGAALLFLVLAGAAFVGLSRETEELSTPSTAGAATIEWQDARPGDLAQLQAAFGTGLAVPFSEKENTTTVEPDRPTTSILGGC